MHNLRKQILKLAIPAALNNLLDTVQLLIDTLMIGRISSEAVAAVGLSGQLIILIYAFLSLFHTGTGALVSRLYGAKDIKDANRAIFTTAIISFFISIPFFIFLNRYSSIYFSFMGTTSTVSNLGESYIYFLSFSIPFLFIGSVLFSGLNAFGDTRTPLYIAIFTNSLNTVLNYCLIFGNCGFPRLEVEGAAIATTISYVTEVFIYLFLFIKGKDNFKIYPSFSFSLFKRVFNVGFPASIEKIFSFSSFLIFVKIIALFGTVTLAGYQIGLRIEGLAFMPGFGFATAAMVLMGQYLGANKVDYAERSVIETIKIGSIFMGSIGILLVVFSKEISSLFSNNIKTVEEAALYLKIVGISQVPLAVDFILNGALRGAGATKITLVINNLSFWIFRIIPAYFVAIFTKEIFYVYLIMVFETFLKGFFLWITFKKGIWKNIEV